MSDQVGVLVEEISTRDETSEKYMELQTRLQACIKEKQVLESQFKVSSDEIKMQLQSLKSDN